jgi:hypothetical protein
MDCVLRYRPSRPGDTSLFRIRVDFGARWQDEEDDPHISLGTSITPRACLGFDRGQRAGSSARTKGIIVGHEAHYASPLQCRPRQAGKALPLKQSLIRDALKALAHTGQPLSNVRSDDFDHEGASGVMRSKWTSIVLQSRGSSISDRFPRLRVAAFWPSVGAFCCKAGLIAERLADPPTACRAKLDMARMRGVSVVMPISTGRVLFRSEVV